jgi:hypothetical protein
MAGIFGNPTGSTSMFGQPTGPSVFGNPTPKKAVSSIGGAVSRKWSPPVTPGGTGSYKAPSGPPTEGPGAVVDIGTWLNQDSGYNQQLAQFANALAQFTGDVTQRRGNLNTDFASSKKAMDDQKVIDLKNLEDDYGSRGIIRSGLYGKAQGDYNTEFDTRATDLASKNQQANAGLDTEVGRYNSQNTLQQQQAREAAIARRAQQYGV